jgi:hypothetical protein
VGKRRKERKRRNTGDKNRVNGRYVGEGKIQKGRKKQV